MSTHTQDSMGYLYDKWLEEKKANLPAVSEFVEFARQKMIENQAVSHDPIGEGMTLRLQDSTVVSWCPAGSVPQMDGLPGFAITQPKMGKDRDITPSPSIGVTGR